MIRVRPFARAESSDWNAFVRSSRNGTFLFERQYVEYHSDRFTDASLVAVADSDRWVAVLPAHRDGSVLGSHLGLTYGGWVIQNDVTTPGMLELFSALRSWMVAQGMNELRYKPLPYIYPRGPAQEDLYALTSLGASLVRRDALSVVDLRHRLPMQARRTRGSRKAEKNGIGIADSPDRLREFWTILEENLRARHGAKPVHSYDEIRSLADAFPENIKLYSATRGGQVVGGSLIFESSSVARAQYIASTEEGRDTGALDFLFITLLDRVYPSKEYFDFGSSMRAPGELDEGLINQKEGFGARTVALDTYVWRLV